MNEEFGYNKLIDAELQVRLMNLVMGEASDFDRDQLQAMMDQRTELAAYYQHLEHLHGLLCEVGAGEPSLDAEASSEEGAWRLSPERRNKVLAVLDCKAQDPVASVVLPNSTYARQKTFWSRRWVAAMVVTAASLLLGVMIYPRVKSARSVALSNKEFDLAGGTSMAMNGNGNDLYLNLPTTAVPRSSVALQHESVPGPVESNTFYMQPGSPPPPPAPAAMGFAEVKAEQSSNDGERRLGRVADKEAGASRFLIEKSGDDFASGGMKASQGGFGGGRFDDDRDLAQTRSWDKNVRDEKGDTSGLATSDANSTYAGSLPVLPQSGQASANAAIAGFDFQSRPQAVDQSAAAPSQPNVSSKRFRFGQAADLPKSELGEWGGLYNAIAASPDDIAAPVPVPGEKGASVDQPNTVGAVNGGTVLSDGIAKFNDAQDSSRFYSFRDHAETALMQNVTPRLIIPEEEEAKVMGVVKSELGQVDANLPMLYPNEELWRDLSVRRNENLGAIDLGVVVDGVKENQATDASKTLAESSKPEADPFSDTQVEFVNPNGPVVVRGSKADVERTLEIVDQMKQQQQAQEGLVAKSGSGALGLGVSEDKGLSFMRLDVLDPMKKELTDQPVGESKSTPDSKAKGIKDAYDHYSNSLTWQSAQSRQWVETPQKHEGAANGVEPELALRETDAFHNKQMQDSPVSDNASDSDAAKGERKEFFEKLRAQEPSPELAANGRNRAKPEVATAGKPAVGSPSKPELSEPEPAKQAKVVAAIDETSAAQEAFSTFSLHVSDVSFKLAQAALSQGQWPEAAKIRIEEFVNALDYRDPLPCGNEKVACSIEQAIHPFLMQRNMLRVSMRTAATGRSLNTPLRLTILLDNSGSMERPDRRQAVLRAFQTLSAQLKANDQITLISFASTPRLLADKVQGNQGETLLQLIENLPSEGGTNIEAALMLAREKASEQQLTGAQNRIVLLTDGAVNLGDANPDSLAKIVTELRDSGIAFDAAGISAQDLNDEVLEALTRQGDGRYYLLDSAQSADESFASQIAGALRPSAQNVKVQVEFNPLRVGRYKLLGFDKHRLDKEDFRNDQVDAAEMAAAEAGVAVYQFEIKPNGTGDVGSVSVRFRDVSSGKMIEHRWPIPHESNTPRIEQAKPSMQLAACAALFAAKLGGGPLADSVDLAVLQKFLSNLPDQFARQPKVQQLRTMVEQAGGR